MKHYNGVARTLNKRPDCYGPLFAVDERHNDILWELRIVGFEKAVKPRPAAWQNSSQRIPKQPGRYPASSHSPMSILVTRAFPKNSSTL